MRACARASGRCLAHRSVSRICKSFECKSNVHRHALPSSLSSLPPFHLPSPPPLSFLSHTATCAYTHTRFSLSHCTVRDMPVYQQVSFAYILALICTCRGSLSTLMHTAAPPQIRPPAQQHPRLTGLFCSVAGLFGHLRKPLLTLTHTAATPQVRPPAPHDHPTLTRDQLPAQRPGSQGDRGAGGGGGGGGGGHGTPRAATPLVR